MTRQILVCDAEHHILRAISLKLTRAGFDVKTVSDVESCWRLLQRGAVPSLLIVDRWFPAGADGADLTRWIRQDVRLAALPVMMLFANQAEAIEQRETLADLKLAQAVGKPFSLRELVESVNQLLDSEKSSTAMPHFGCYRASDCKL